LSVVGQAVSPAIGSGQKVFQHPVRLESSFVIQVGSCPKG
jgi:hypothetical protein